MHRNLETGMCVIQEPVYTRCSASHELLDSRVISEKATSTEEGTESAELRSESGRLTSEQKLCPVSFIAN